MASNPARMDLRLDRKRARVGSASQGVATAVFLTSRTAGYTIGTNLPVDGGALQSL